MAACIGDVSGRMLRSRLDLAEAATVPVINGAAIVPGYVGYREHTVRSGETCTLQGTTVSGNIEVEDGGRPRPGSQWRELCMASVTTHDLPPTAGYLQGVHVELRHRLGLLDRTLEEELAEDGRSRGEVIADLRRRGLLREGANLPQQVEALHAFLTRTPALPQPSTGLSMA